MEDDESKCRLFERIDDTYGKEEEIIGETMYRQPRQEKKTVWFIMGFLFSFLWFPDSLTGKAKRTGDTHKKLKKEGRTE